MQATQTSDASYSEFDIRQTTDERQKRALFGLGLRSLLSIGLAPLGRKAARFHSLLASPGRLEHGLIIILPGIEGCSSINDSVARGLVAAQLPHAVRIIDWRKFRPWNPLHLMMERHNRAQANVVADVIRSYQSDYPQRPVHLIGHSAGAGMALFVLEQLQRENAVDSVVLLAAAVSRQFNVHRLLQRTKNGIWNFYSPFDLPTTGLGTMLFGTMDRRHTISAGAMGFRGESLAHSAKPYDDAVRPELHQIKFQAGMIKSWNFGGHFGSTNAVFVRQHVAPILEQR